MIYKNDNLPIRVEPNILIVGIFLILEFRNSENVRSYGESGEA